MYAVSSSILNAAYLGPNLSVPIVNPICSTAQCTWPNYGSLAICVELKNVTDSANILLLGTYFKGVVQEYYNLIANLPPVYPVLILTWPSPSNLFDEMVGRAAIVEHWIAFSNTMVNLTDYANVDTSSFQFFAVAFFFCTKTLSSDVDAGVPHISEVSSTLNILSSPVESLNYWWNMSLLSADLTCGPPLAGTSMVLGGPTGLTTETYAVDVCTGLIFSNYFGLLTQGVILLGSDLTVDFEYGQMSQALSLAIFGEFNYQNTVTKDPATQFDAVMRMMENVADSVTNVLKQDGSTFSGSSGTVEGIAYQPQTIVQVHWAWLSPLSCYVIFAAIFLVSIILWTYVSGMQTLKRSSLAMMVAVDRSVKEELGTLEGPGNLEEKAKRIYVTLGSRHLVKSVPE